MALFDGELQELQQQHGSRHLPADVAAPMPVELAVVAPRVITTQWDYADFVPAANQAVSPPGLSDILVRTVPEGLAARVSGPDLLDQGYGLRLAGRATGAATSGGTGILVIDVPTATLRLIENPNSPGAGSVIVQTRIGAGAETIHLAANITVDFTLNRVTIAAAAGLAINTAFNWTVDGLIGDALARVEWHVSHAGSVAGVERRPIEEVGLRSLHARDQLNARTGRRYATRGTLLAPYDQLIVAFRSSQRFEPRPATAVPGPLTELTVNVATLPWVELVNWFQATRPDGGWTETRARQLVLAQQMGRLEDAIGIGQALAALGLASQADVPPLPPGFEVG